MISVKNVTMKFNLGIEATSFKETFISLFDKKRRVSKEKNELLALNNVSDSMKFLYTVIYIVFFLLDDLIVFFIAMFTMKITGISTKYNKYSHLIGGIIMLLIGVLLVFKPEWLMFQFK